MQQKLTKASSPVSRVEKKELERRRKKNRKAANRRRQEKKTAFVSPVNAIKAIKESAEGTLTTPVYRNAQTRPFRDEFNSALTNKLSKINPEALESSIIRNTFNILRFQSEKLQTKINQRRLLNTFIKLNRALGEINKSRGAFEDPKYQENARLLKSISTKISESTNPTAIDWKAFFDN